FMRKHFMIGAWLTSLDNFTSGRLHTMLTSSFSHMDLKHLFNNMVGLYFFGSSIARTFGPGFLFQLYVTGALTGSVFYLAEKIFLAPRKEVICFQPRLSNKILWYDYIISDLVHIISCYFHVRRLVFSHFAAHASYLVPAKLLGSRSFFQAARYSS
uniref:Peptidase S54 rhomboid domain-containing protein n=2 Tax=Aegilops tauschii subsp. strangulata TaxID=200361 RepID=A0A453PYF9_AEGTS